MGIRFYCPNGCKLHVKAFQAGMRGICPHCGCSVDIPLQSTRGSSKKKPRTNPAASEPQAQENEANRSIARPAGMSGHSVSTGAAQPGTARAAPDLRERKPPPLPSLGPMTGPGIEAGGLYSGEPGFPAGEAAGTAPFKTPAATPPDPFKESPDAVWYVCPPTGGQYGPATNEVMRSWLAEGRVPPESKVWRSGWIEWKSAADVFAPALFPSMAASNDFPATAPLLPPNAPDFPVPTHRGARPAPSTVVQLVILLAVLALGGGILAAVYVWARFF